MRGEEGGGDGARKAEEAAPGTLVCVWKAKAFLSHFCGLSCLWQGRPKREP